jgi:hypothetical protein
MGVATNQMRADELCGVLNLAFQLDGAEAELRDGRYTGRVVLDRRSTAQLIAERKVLEAAVQELSGTEGLPAPVARMRTASARRRMREAWGL